MSLLPDSTVLRKSDPDEHERKMQALKDALRSGAHLSTAAAYAGINVRTLGRWIEEGIALAEIADRVSEDPDDEREPSPNELELIWLARDVERTMAATERRHAQNVAEAANEGEWRASAWWLEHGPARARWAKRTEVTGADGGAVEVDHVEARQAVDDALDLVASRLGELEGGAEVVEISPDKQDEAG